MFDPSEPKKGGAMRILMITSDHLMIDRRIIQEAQSFIGAGFEVTLLAGFECPEPSAFESNGINIKRFTYDWSDTRVDHVMRKLPLRSQKWRQKAWGWSRDVIEAVTKLTSFEHFVLRQVMFEDFDILHCHDYPLLPVAVEAARRRSVPLVYDAHELYHAQVQLPNDVRRRYRAREKKLIKFPNLNITVNPFIAEIMGRDYGIQPPAVILNAAPPLQAESESGLREQLAIQPNERIVLYQGWMSPERGIDSLVKAAAHFPSHIRLVLIGYGSHEADLRAISRDQGTDDGRVIFFGQVDSSALPRLTRGADLGVIPYHGVDLNNYYCSPNKLFEFAVCGIPFVSNDLPYLRSVVEQYGFGIATDLRSPQQAAQIIVSLLEDDERLGRLKSAAEHASRVLNWDVEGRKLVQLYEQYVLPKVAGGRLIGCQDPRNAKVV